MNAFVSSDDTIGMALVFDVDFGNQSIWCHIQNSHVQLEFQCCTAKDPQLKFETDMSIHYLLICEHSLNLPKQRCILNCIEFSNHNIMMHLRRKLNQFIRVEICYNNKIPKNRNIHFLTENGKLIRPLCTDKHLIFFSFSAFLSFSPALDGRTIWIMAKIAILLLLLLGFGCFLFYLQEQTSEKMAWKMKSNLLSVLDAWAHSIRIAFVCMRKKYWWTQRRKIGPFLLIRTEFYFSMK